MSKYDIGNGWTAHFIPTADHKIGDPKALRFYQTNERTGKPLTYLTLPPKSVATLRDIFAKIEAHETAVWRD